MLYLSTASVPAPDQAAALETLDRFQVPRAWVVPGREPGPRWGALAAQHAERLALHHDCLVAPGEPRWNLAASDEGLRRRAVDGAMAAMRQAAELGAPFYSVHPGWALTLTLDAEGHPTGPEQSRAKAHDHLCRSLDRLASLADDLGLKLLVENTAGSRKTAVHLSTLPLWQEPDEIHQTLDRLAAPPLGLLLDVGHLLLSSRVRHWEPEPVVDELVSRVRAIVVARNDGVRNGRLLPVEDGIELQLAKRAGGLSVPVILDARDLEESAVAWAMEVLTGTLTPATSSERP
jgi:sugar phosphate isomerase/epimerase